MSLIPGVPQLLPGAALPVTVAIATEVVSGLLWQASLQPPAWGVFDSAGNLMIDADSVLEFTHRKEYEISDYPIQEGEFGSYNKVIRPFEVQLRFSKSGTLTDRAQFLQSIEDLAESLALYSVVTPERTYGNMNLERYEVSRRGARGAYFLTEVDCYFREVIQVTPQYTTSAVQLPNAQSAAAQPTSNVGTVNPTAPTSARTLQGQAALSSLPDPGLY